jgi:hypothetical protein
VWKRKQEELKKDECGFAMYVEGKGSQRCIDSEFSKHVAGD